MKTEPKKQVDDREKQRQGDEAGTFENVVQPFAHLRPNGRRLGTGSGRGSSWGSRDRDHQNGADSEEKRHQIDGDQTLDRDRDKQRTSGQRCQDPPCRMAKLHHARSFAELLLGHQQGGDRHESRLLKRHEGGSKGRDHVDVPNGELVGPQQANQGDRAEGRAAVAQNHHPLAIPAVDQGARDGRHQQAGDGAEHHDQGVLRDRASLL